jgi:hypothetical protein
MGILAGSASLTRYNVAVLREAPDFDRERFVEIDPGSPHRESSGFLPHEPEAPYETGAARFFFRVRFDKLRADPVAVDERLRELVRVELEQGAQYVGPRKRKMLKEQAEEELVALARPRSKIIEGCIDGGVLYIGSTAKAYLGRITELLRRVGVHPDLKTPWLDHGDPEIESTILEPREPGESILGSRFLRELVGHAEIMIEPEQGAVRLQTSEARVSLGGGVLPELMAYLEDDVELISAKLVTALGPFRFDALPFRVSGLRIETQKHEHWFEQLDERLQKFGELFELLEKVYLELRPAMIKS